MHFIGVMLLLTFVSSCGKSNSSAGLPIVKEKIIPANGSNIEGLYMAKFYTLNPQVNGTLPGSATIQRREDKFYAYVRLFGGAPNAWHQQNIYEGTRCPNMDDDLNGDGYLDIEESRNVLGNVLIPLDSNLSSQSAGKNIFPIGDASGTYFYERVSSFDKMFSDLKSEDKNLSDNIVKLPEDKGLDMEGKVVVIQGTADTVTYPETVATTDRHLPHQTLPIACGVFAKVTSIPGEAETGEVPGPVEAPGEVTPVPEPTPAPTPEPIPEYPSEYPEDDYTQPRNEEEDDDEWYDRVIDWWRERWDRARGNRDTGWGDGEWL